MKTFKNLADLNSSLAFDVIERLSGVSGIAADFSASNISESAYVHVAILGEDENEYLKLRFSCHGDRHGSDHTFRTDEDARVMFVWYEAGEPTYFGDDGEPVEFDMVRRDGTDDDRNDAGVPRDEAEFDHVKFPGARYEEIVTEAAAMATAMLKEAA